MQKVILILLLVSGLANAQPSPTPSPTPIKGFIDPCKLQTQSPAHAAWKAANCS